MYLKIVFKKIIKNSIFVTILFSLCLGGLLNQTVDAEENQKNSEILSNISNDPWPMFRQNLKHTARTIYTGPATPEIAWSYSTGDGIISSAAISSDGTIYVGSGCNDTANDPFLYAFNPDGTVKWKFDSNSGYFSSPAITEDGRIYIVSYDGWLYAIKDEGSYAKLEWKNWLEYFFNLCSPTVDENGIIHVGSPSFTYFQIYPFGIKKYRYKTGSCIISSAAIDDDGTVYVGSKDHYLYAFKSDEKKLKWRFATGEFFDGHCVDSSPAIGDDGTIYVGTDTYDAFGQNPINVTDNFWAINPDGTLKWIFETDDGVESSPAIGFDGTIYFGSYDGYLYAVEDIGNQGLLKWKFKTHGAIDGSPVIDGDGVIYFASRDSYIYALYPNGTLKWKLQADGGFESSLSIDDKGFLYIGGFGGTFYCIGSGNSDIGVSSIDISRHIPPETFVYPKATITNHRRDMQFFNITCNIEHKGAIIYSQTIQNNILGGISKQITFQQCQLGEEYDLEYNITFSTNLTNDENEYNDIRSAKITTSENMPPEKPNINGPASGSKGKKYKYYFSSNDLDDDVLFYFIDWGDGTNSDWLGPYNSGEKKSVAHFWDGKGNYEIRIKCKDIFGTESDWENLEVSMPQSKILINSLFFRLFDLFPNAFPFLRIFLGL